MKKEERTLASNTIMLYLLTFSVQLLNFVTTPYLTRILGPGNFGRIGIAIAYMSYVQLVLDMGFILSATSEVSQNRNNPEKLSQILCTVTVIKLALCAAVFIAFCIIAAVEESVGQDFRFLGLYIIAYSINALMPDFFYRGIEQMQVITFRTLAARTIYAVLVFAFVKKADDYIMLPLFLLFSNLLAFFVVFQDLSKRKVHWVRIKGPSIKRLLFKTFPYFCSRISSTFYQALNTVILNAIYGTGSSVIGYYSSADKAIALVKTGTSPIADSLFPYMVKRKNYKLIKILMLIAMPLIVIGCALVYIYAVPLCTFVFGEGYEQAGILLRYLMPIAVVIFPSYIICFPLLVPMGLSRYANISNVVGLVTQMTGLIGLSIVSELNVFNICILTSVSEVSVFLFRLGVLVRYRNRLKETL